MLRNLAAAGILVLAAAAAASAHTVDSGLSGVAPTYAQPPGWSVTLGVFHDVSGVDDPSNAHHHPFATGGCRVVVDNPQLHGSRFVFACGVDRNDDGLLSDAAVCNAEDDSLAHPLSDVTNHDECTGEGSCAPDCGAGEGHADDWVTGISGVGCLTFVAPPDPAGSGCRDFCFQDDVRGFTDDRIHDTGLAGGDVSAVNQAVFPPSTGSGWDDLAVFVGATGPPSLATHVGGVFTGVHIVGAPGCGGNVSAHATPGNPRTV